MIKAILFDFWGTLVEQGVWSPIKQVQNILDIRMPFSEYVVRMERAMMTRQFGQLQEAFEAVATEFKVPCSPQRMEQLIGMWNKSWMLAKPYPEVEASLAALQEKYTLILISNTDPFGVRRVLEKYKLDPHFTKIYLSCEEGKLKTDPEFMNKILLEQELTAEECLVVGDSIHSDIEPALKLGMNAVLIDRNNAREFSPKIISLGELPGVWS